MSLWNSSAALGAEYLSTAADSEGCHEGRENVGLVLLSGRFMVVTSHKVGAGHL